MNEGRFSGSNALIGRSEQQREAMALLDEYALVTLTGPGGVGKTTLAMSLADEAAERFDGDVLVAELAGTSDDEDVAGLVARQLDANSLDALRLRSAGRRTLVVLDNCESALAASRTIVGELVGGDSDIRVLATSRSPLYAMGERLVPIRPLAVSADEPEQGPADGRSDAERLFLARSQEAGASWPETPENLEAVRQLTNRLNGLPLAIELAAARSRVLGPVELVQLLDRQLDLLVRPGGSGGPVGSDVNGERHHSLRRVIEASYEPLSPTLQHFLRCLSFMSAPFDLALAHAVAGGQGPELDTLELLSQLIDASLLEARQTAAGRTQYLLLDSIRAFGQERLREAGQWAEVGERYVDGVTAIAMNIVAAALESFSPEVMGAIRDKSSHLVNAVTWCLEHDPSPARTYQMFLLFYGPLGTSLEIAELARRVRDNWDQPAPLQAEAFAVMGSLTFRVGRYTDGAELAAKAVAHPDATDMAKFMARRTLGYEAAVRRDNETARQHIDAAVGFGRAFSAAFDREIRISRAAMVWDADGSPETLASLSEVRREATEAGEWVMVVWAGTMMGHHHRLLGDMPAALRASEAALAVAEDSEIAWASITAHYHMAALLALDQGWSAAAPHFRLALDAAAGIGDLDGCATVLRTTAGAAGHAGHHGLAAKLWATVPDHPGVAIPPSVFDAEEQKLNAEHGPGSALSVDVLIRNARQLLSQPEPAGAAADRVAATTAPESGSGTETESEAVTIVFGEYELDPAMCELRRGGERVPMEPQVYDVLVYLIERRGSLVTKNELLDEVWGDRFVSEAALSSRIAAARKATGDNGKDQRVIRTVHGRGFSFVAEVGSER